MELNIELYDELVDIVHKEFCTESRKCIECPFNIEETTLCVIGLLRAFRDKL